MDILTKQQYEIMFLHFALKYVTVNTQNGERGRKFLFHITCYPQRSVPSPSGAHKLLCLDLRSWSSYVEACSA